MTRDKELKLYLKQQLLSTLLRSVFMTLPILMVVLVIGLYGYIGGDIKASMAFTTISLMEMVRRPLMMISWILVRDPTTWTWTILQQDGPYHLGLWYNARPEHKMALITSGSVPFRTPSSLTERRALTG